MEIYINDKTKKAFYVFPWGTTPISAITDTARDRHINPNKLEAAPGWVKGDELFPKLKKGGKKVLVVYKPSKAGGFTE